MSCLYVQAVLSRGDPVANVAIYVASAVLAPAVEELIYRGFLLRSLASSMPTPAAVRQRPSPMTDVVRAQHRFTRQQVLMAQHAMRTDKITLLATLSTPFSDRLPHRARASPVECGSAAGTEPDLGSPGGGQFSAFCRGAPYRSRFRAIVYTWRSAGRHTVGSGGQCARSNVCPCTLQCSSPGSHSGGHQGNSTAMSYSCALTTCTNLAC